MTDVGRAFLVALNRNLTDATALAGEMPENLRDAAGLTDGALVDILTTKATASRALVTDGDGDVGASSVTSTELGYVNGVTSSIQSQINAKAATADVAAALALKAANGANGDITSLSGLTTPLSEDQGGTGLDDVLDLPISTLTQAALDLKLTTTVLTGASPASAGVDSVLALKSGGFVAAKASFSNVKDRGATGNGIADDTTPFANWTSTGGLGVIPTGTYLTAGAVGTPPAPRVILADDDATHDGTLFPLFSVSRVATKDLPQHYLYVRQDNTDRDDEWTARVDRLVNADPAATGGRGLQVTTDVNVDTDSTEWALSGVMNNYSDTASSGNTATSGVANKYGLATVFGGHFQANDHNTYASATDVTAAVGFEANIQAIGVEHPTANNGLGYRRVGDIVAKTLSGAAAEIGVGLLIRHDSGASNAYFRYGLAVEEISDNGNHMTAGVLIRTYGARGIDVVNAHTTAGIQVRGNSPYGLLLTGTHTAAAIRLNQSEYIAMEATATIKTGYVGATAIWGFFSSTNERIGFNMGATPVIRVAGTQVVSARKTGWATATGTATRTTFDTTTVTTAQLAERVKALIDDLHGTAGHGLIGT